MPKPTKGPRFGGSPAHQRIILANLATQLFQHGKITTTEAKAKRLQPLADRLISKAKRGDLHNRRIVLQTVTDPAVVRVLFNDIAPAVAEREGGYTRITKIGPRKGDNAPMAVIEVITESVEDSRKAKAKGAGKPVAKPEEDGRWARIAGSVKGLFTRDDPEPKPAEPVKPNCRMVPVQREFRRPIAYDVDYVYQGIKYRSRLAEDPGNRLRIRISVTPQVPGQAVALP